MGMSEDQHTEELKLEDSKQAEQEAVQHMTQVAEDKLQELVPGTWACKPALPLVEDHILQEVDMAL